MRKDRVGGHPQSSAQKSEKSTFALQFLVWPKVFCHSLPGFSYLALKLPHHTILAKSQNDSMAREQRSLQDKLH